MNGLDWARVYASMAVIVGSRLITSGAGKRGSTGDDARIARRWILTLDRVRQEFMGWTTAADRCWSEAGS
jgi:hypothetical protein